METETLQHLIKAKRSFEFARLATNSGDPVVVETDIGQIAIYRVEVEGSELSMWVRPSEEPDYVIRNDVRSVEVLATLDPLKAHARVVLQKMQKAGI